MNSKPLAALLSTLISQLTLLVILLFPSSPFSLDHSHTHSFDTLSSLIHSFISSSESISLLNPFPRKRRRTHLSEPETHLGTGFGSSKLAQLFRVDSVLVQNPDSFRCFFKMAPSTFEWLCGLLEPLLECRDPVGQPIDLSAELRLGIGLYRLATGSDYPEITDRFRVTERVARFCCKQLCRVLCTNFRFWVGFPEPIEFDFISNKFEDLTGLKNCCGFIGCTRFKVSRPETSNGSISSDFKDDTLAVQIVVDSSCRILSIFAGCHGNKGNFKILKLSTLYKDILEGNLLNTPPIYEEGVAIPQYLVGEKGYPLLDWLMVQYDNPKQGSHEERFNTAIGFMRASLLKTIASLKNWGILSKPVNEESRNIVAYIGACSILHNALLLREDYSGLCDGVEEYVSHDHGLEHFKDIEEKNSTKGGVFRDALAMKVKNLSEIKRSDNK